MGIKIKVITLLSGFFSGEVTIILLAALPVFELRLAVPLGIIKFHLPLAKVYLLSLLGNMLPVLPLLFFFSCFLQRLERLRGVGKIFGWWFRKVRKRSGVVERWGFWGLVCFVAIPLPITGAWTGSIAATLFEVRIKKAFFAILIGVATAGLIVCTLSVGASKTISLFLKEL